VLRVVDEEDVNPLVSGTAAAGGLVGFKIGGAWGGREIRSYPYVGPAYLAHRMIYCATLRLRLGDWGGAETGWRLGVG